MKKFDCLEPHCPLWGNHLLEASAGTGKTFSIEQVFVRLVLEGIELEKILAVTFTKAATRELKARIGSNLEKACHAIQAHILEWPYLAPYLGSFIAADRCQKALAGFDRCQIFTIHGFCFRQLQEFAFEARLGMLQSEETNVPQSLRTAALDFLTHGIEETLLCEEQLGLLLKEFSSLEEIVEALVQMKTPKSSLCYSELWNQCKAALQPWGLEFEKLKEDFEKHSKNYKKMKGNFEIQLRGLAEISQLPLLLKERGSIFDFLDSKNRKVRVEEIQGLHYPGFFDWAKETIAPLTKQRVFPVLQRAFLPIGERILEQEEFLDPDMILLKMKQALDIGDIQTKLQKKYEAVIIDEFQDTDTIQWEIFQKLFFAKNLCQNNLKNLEFDKEGFQNSHSERAKIAIEEGGSEHANVEASSELFSDSSGSFGIKALYLVGDPKQSIYRFRGADVYTYLKARHVLGEENCYLLDTNFRSSRPMIEALNALFERDWLHLPQEGKVLSYYPVKAGSSIEMDFQDGKGAIHCIAAEGESLFQEVFLPYAASEIETLGLKGCALLVKDHAQASFALEFLRKRGIAAIAKSKIPLSETASFQAISELIDAIGSLQNRNRIMAGPFAKADLYLPFYKKLLEEKGLVALAKELALDADGLQVFEHLFAWEQKEGFSFEGLKRQLHQMKSQEEICRSLEEIDADVQIMTLHVSKGLEFDVVFALGLASRTPLSEDFEEINAEKMRQLYVAMTRAKKRLYFPIALEGKETEEGAHSPMECFARYFSKPLLEEIEALSQKQSITLEKISQPFVLPAKVVVKKERQQSLHLDPFPFTPCLLSSFTTLAKPEENKILSADSVEEGYTLQTMPKGTATGNAIHALFEALFRSRNFLWQDPKGIETLVIEQVRHTPLEPWQKAIQEMVLQTLNIPFQGRDGLFSLSQIDRFQVEMEFLFPRNQDFVKGFIDLVFYVGNEVYFLDWKTNFLQSYEPQALEKAMQAHDYGLQISLYQEAIERHFKAPFGGAYYVFVRGNAYLKYFPF